MVNKQIICVYLWTCFEGMRDEQRHSKLCLQASLRRDLGAGRMPTKAKVCRMFVVHAAKAFGDDFRSFAACAPVPHV